MLGYLSAPQYNTLGHCGDIKVDGMFALKMRATVWQTQIEKTIASPKVITLVVPGLYLSFLLG